VIKTLARRVTHFAAPEARMIAAMATKDYLRTGWIEIEKEGSDGWRW
jgi:hypothetical protein